MAALILAEISTKRLTDFWKHKCNKYRKGELLYSFPTPYFILKQFGNLQFTAWIMPSVFDVKKAEDRPKL